jgi:hypothetical protein
MQEEDHMRKVETVQSSTTKCEKRLSEIFKAIRNSLNGLATSKDREEAAAGDDDQADAKRCKLSEHAEPGCMMDTISKLVQHRVEMFW